VIRVVIVDDQPVVRAGVARILGSGDDFEEVVADALTDREHDVLRYMARGATNSEIAAALFVSEPTVKSQVGSIFSKLAVRDRAAAIVFAYDQGIVDPRAG
jgi:DNA-binding NarL/FixJ family response regulator